MEAYAITQEQALASYYTVVYFILRNGKQTKRTKNVFAESRQAAEMSTGIKKTTARRIENPVEIEQIHHDLIEEAILEGKEISEEVLAGYPDLWETAEIYRQQPAHCKGCDFSKRSYLPDTSIKDSGFAKGVFKSNLTGPKFAGWMCENEAYEETNPELCSCGIEERKAG